MAIKRIHVSKLHELVERTDASGAPVTFSLKYVKRSTGQVIFMDNLVCSSFHSEGQTLNVLSLTSKEVRKLRRVLIVEFNGITVDL